MTISAVLGDSTTFAVSGGAQLFKFFLPVVFEAKASLVGGALPPTVCSIPNVSTEVLPAGAMNAGPPGLSSSRQCY